MQIHRIGLRVDNRFCVPKMAYEWYITYANTKFASWGSNSVLGSHVPIEHMVMHVVLTHNHIVKHAKVIVQQVF